MTPIHPLILLRAPLHPYTSPPLTPASPSAGAASWLPTVPPGVPPSLPWGGTMSGVMVFPPLAIWLEGGNTTTPVLAATPRRLSGTPGAHSPSRCSCTGTSFLSFLFSFFFCLFCLFVFLSFCLFGLTSLEQPHSQSDEKALSSDQQKKPCNLIGHLIQGRVPIVFDAAEGKVFSANVTQK